LRKPIASAWLWLRRLPRRFIKSWMNILHEPPGSAQRLKKNEGYLSHPFARDKKCDTGRAVQLLVIFRSMNDFSHAPSAKPIRGAVEVRSYFGN
jgi:hypothetical protein